MREIALFPGFGPAEPLAFDADELIVDLFAGGGGASLGIEMALGRSPDIAVNHDADAIRMHAVNHPATLHLQKNVWQVDPIEHVGRRKVGLLWASPDCKHHSKAKGGKPLKRNIRDLAWVVVHWAKRVRPRVILLENVEEFRDWGPLTAEGRPCPERKGQTFEAWATELRRLGYKLEHRELAAKRYATPTTRKRLFVVARRDGKPIVWPAESTGAPQSPGVLAGTLAPERTAAECIDWSIPCPSIFLTRAEARKIGCNRPLAENTMARIAKGVKRYVIDAAKPFIVPITHTGDARVHDVGEPLRTITCAPRGEHALVSPVIVRTDQTSGDATRRGVHSVEEPLRTLATGGSFAVAAPYLVPRYGEREGQEPRTLPVDRPLPTVVPTNNGGSLVAAHLQRQFGASVGQAADEPVATIMPGGGGKTALVAAFLNQHNTDMVGHAATEPVSTIVGKGCTQALTAAHLLSLKGSERRDQPVDRPAPTICAQGFHVAEVRAFLLKYYRTAIGQAVDGPMHTITSEDRLGLVMVHGEPYEIVDIGMRMLSPRELFRAQGFPDSYIIDRDAEGRPITSTAQVKCCGNSVCPPVAAALVAANCADLAKLREAAE